MTAELAQSSTHADNSSQITVPPSNSPTTTAPDDTECENVTIDGTCNDNQSLCVEGSYLDVNDTGICRPTCGEFMKREIALKQIAFVLGFISCIMIFILALTIQRDAL